VEWTRLGLLSEKKTPPPPPPSGAEPYSPFATQAPRCLLWRALSTARITSDCGGIEKVRRTRVMADPPAPGPDWDP